MRAKCPLDGWECGEGERTVLRKLDPCEDDLAVFVAISIAYAEFLHTPQTQLLIGKKKLGEDGLHYILHFILITMEPMACAGPPSGEWAN